MENLEIPTLFISGATKNTHLNFLPSLFKKIPWLFIFSLLQIEKETISQLKKQLNDVRKKAHSKMSCDEGGFVLSHPSMWWLTGVTCPMGTISTGDMAGLLREPLSIESMDLSSELSSEL